MFWDRWKNHVLSDRFRSSEVTFPRECTLEYMHWYLRVSHPYVQNPKFRSTYDAGQSSYSSAPSISNDPRLVGALRYLEPIVDCGSGSTPLYDDMYHMVEESVHLLNDLRLDPLVASQDTIALTASDRHTLRTFFRRECRNSRNYMKERHL